MHYWFSDSNLTICVSERSERAIHKNLLFHVSESLITELFRETMHAIKHKHLRVALTYESHFISHANRIFLQVFFQL